MPNRAAADPADRERSRIPEITVDGKLAADVDTEEDFAKAMDSGFLII
ncbi:MAG: hypothetical protein OXQ29_26575 [Rhodospirillaceae bacterium]|nr:hypothetical protein [Rhodospirillaceae bacterium]